MDTEIIEELLNSKADVNTKDIDGDTPLHDAAINGYTDAVKMLLKRGADLNVRNKDNMTALHVALNCHEDKRHDIISDLINFNADVNVRDNNGKTPLQIAQRTKDKEAVHILLKNGAVGKRTCCFVM